MDAASEEAPAVLPCGCATRRCVTCSCCSACGSAPPLTCKCKVARCGSCFACSKCACSCAAAAARAPKTAAPAPPRKSRRSAASEATQAIQRHHQEIKAHETEFLLPELDGCFAPDAKPKARQVYAAFGWGEGALASIGAEAKRENPDLMHGLSEKNWAEMSRALLRAVDRLAEVLCPADPAELQRRARAKLGGEVQRRARATPDNEKQPHGEKSHGKKTHDNLISNLVGILEKAPTTSVDSRAVRAILCGEAPLKDIWASIPADSKLQMASKTYAKARKDFKVLQNGGSLVPENIRRTRFDPEAVDVATRFILREEHVGALFWARREVPVTGGTTVSIPDFVRKISRANLYKKYKSAVTSKQLSRTSMFMLLNLLTTGQSRVLSAVDGVAGELVYDNFRRVERVIAAFIHDGSQRQLHKLMHVTMNFLKNQYGRHVLTDDGEHTHGITYGLGAASDNLAPRTADCSGCKIVPYFFTQLKTRVAESSVAGVEKSMILDQVDCMHHKARLYMAHKVRVVNQRREIESLHRGMQARCIQEELREPREAHVVADFKKEFFPGGLRGRTSINWHGFLVSWYEYNPETKTADRQTVFCDQIIRGTSKQGGDVVAALLEVFVAQLHRDVPSLQSITLQSDNAACYHAKPLIAAIPYIGKHTGLPILRHIKTEAQDGRGPLDAAFARSIRHLNDSLVEGVNVGTEEEVFDALILNGGAPNSFAQLVDISRRKLDLLDELRKDFFEVEMQPYKRFNDAFFTFDLAQDPDIPTDPEALVAYSLPTTVQAYTYSGMAFFKNFEVDMGRGTCTLTQESGPGFRAEDEYDASVSDREEDEDEADASIAASAVRRPMSPAADSSMFGAEVAHSTPIGELTSRKRRGQIRTSGRGTTGADSRSLKDDLACGLEGVDEDGIDPVGDEARAADALAAVEDADIARDAESVTGDDSEAQEYAEVARGGESMPLAEYALRKVENNFRDGSERMRDMRSAQPEYDEAKDFVIPLTDRNKPGWAHRPPHGKLYGEKINMDPWRATIREIFEQSAQQSASQILEGLEKRYPFRLDIPGAADINTEIQRLVRLQKEDRPLDSQRARQSAGLDQAAQATHSSAQAERAPKRKRHRLDPRYIATLQDALDRSLSTIDALGFFRERWGQTEADWSAMPGDKPASYPDDKQLKIKLANMKQALKKQRSEG